MKKLVLIWLALITLPSFASTLSFKKLECTIGDSYGIRYIPSQKIVELWEFAGGLGRPLQDFVVKSDIRSKTKVTLKIAGQGELFVEFSDPWVWPTGTWEHNHKLDKYLIDASEDHGSSELRECVKE